MNAIISDYIENIKRNNDYLSDECLNFLSQKFEIQNLKSKEFFIIADTQDINVGFIHKGLIRVFYTDESGNDKTFNFIKENQVATDYKTFNKGSKSKFYFQCLEDTTIIKINKADVDTICFKFPEFERFYRLQLEKVFEDFFSRVESFLFENAEERYIQFAEKNKDIFNRISISLLCSYLGVERQTLTRIRQKLAKK